MAIIFDVVRKYPPITPATTTLKVIVSSTTQVLAVTSVINTILFKQDESSPLKTLLTSTAQSLKKAVDKLEDSGKEPCQRTKSPPPSDEPVEPAEPVLFMDEHKPTTARTVSAPVVSFSNPTIVNVKRALTTAPTVTRSSTPTSPQKLTNNFTCPELFDALHEIDSLINKQALNTSTSVPDSLIFNRKKANSVEETSSLSLLSSSSPSIGSVGLNTSSDGTGSKIISPKPLPPIPNRLPSLPPVPVLPSSSSSSTTNDTSNDSKSPESTTKTKVSDSNATLDASTKETDPSDTTDGSLVRSGSAIIRSNSASPLVSPRNDQQAPPSPTQLHSNGGPTTPSELNEMLSWSSVRAEGFRHQRISMRVGSFSPGTLSSSSPLSPTLSPPLSPVNSPPEPPVVTAVRKASKKEDMTLSKLFGLIPGDKEEQRLPHASKKLLKMLVALVAAYSSAIDMGIAEIKDIAARVNSETPRPSSSFSLALDPNASVPIGAQYLTDALLAIETGIPPIPPTPPPQLPSTTSTSENGRQSGDAGVEIWSEPPDEEGVNVLFNELGKIRAGTLNKLVERLTSPTEADLKFMKTFITTYRSFCTPETLLQKIMQRFDVPEAEAASELPIRLRVCNVLRQWVADQYLDFDQQLIETLITFIEDKLVNHKSYKTFATSLLNTIAAKKQSVDVTRVVTADVRGDSKGIQLSPSRLLFVFDEEEIAKQLTLIDFSIYSAIQPVELLNLAWNTPKYKYRAPHVTALIARANLLSNWVASVILWQPKLRDRVKIFAKMISIAKHLRDLNNFNSLVAVLAGLNNSAIHRLKFSREDLPKQSQETFKELEEVMNVNASYKTYRGLLHNVNPPCLPFLGVYLTDLTFVEEGNPDQTKNLINFGKRELVHNILAEIQQYQLTSYVFPLVDNIASFLDQLPHIQGDKDMYNLSLLREPREAARESIV